MPLCPAAGHRSGTSLPFPHIVQANPTSSSLDSLRDSLGGVTPFTYDQLGCLLVAQLVAVR